MSENIAEVLESKATPLFEKLSQNVDLSNVIMGFISFLIFRCNKLGKPIEGVDTTNVVEFDDEFRFGITFNTLVITTRGVWQSKGDLLSYVRSKNLYLGAMLERNQKLIRTFADLVSVVEKYCERKRMPFRDFKIKKGFVHPGTNTCIIRAGVPEFKDRFR